MRGYGPRSHHQGFPPFADVPTVVAITAPASADIPATADYLPGPIWPTEVPAGSVPAQGSIFELGTRFTTHLDGYATHLRYYRVAGDTAGHVLNLWRNSDTTIIGTANLPASAVVGWHQVALAAPVALSYLETYTAAVIVAATDPFPLVNNYFDAQVVTGMFTMPISAGRYTVGGGYPNTLGTNPCYYVDVVYSAVDPPAVPVRTATMTVPRWDRNVTVPYLQTSRDLTVTATVDTAAPSVRFALAGGPAAMAPVVAGSASHTFAGLAGGDYTLTAVACDAYGRAYTLAAGSVATVAQVGVGDIAILLGESTTEGWYATAYTGALAVALLDRWDHARLYNNALVSTDNRTWPQLAPTTIAVADSGAGAHICYPPSVFPVAANTWMASYASALAAALATARGYPVMCINLAYGGHTTEALVGHAGMGLLHANTAAIVAALAPNLALAYTGVNDAWYTANVGDPNPQTAEQDYTDLVTWAAAQVGGVGAVWLATPPASTLVDLTAWAAAVGATVTATGCNAGPDLFAAGIATSDGTHPTEAGYVAIAAAWAAAL